MAIVKNDPFPGTDYSQYMTWKSVTLPSGQIVYEVPGNPGYVFDPVASNATGRKVFKTNPRLAIEDQRKQQDLQDAKIKQQQYNQSLLGQATPVALGTAGIIAANQFIPKSGSEILAENLIKQQTGKAAAQTAAQSAASGAVSSVAPNAVVSDAAGNVVASQVPAGFYASGATEATAPTVLGNAAGMGILPLAGIAAGTYLGGKALYDMYKGDKPNILGRGILGVATGGLSEIAKATGLLGRKTTRDIAKEHTEDLLNQGKNDSNYQSYVKGMREQYNSAPPDPSKPFAGKYGSWDEYKSAGLESGDLTGVYGNIKTFGPEWANLSQEQRQAVTQGLIDADLYTSKKGEVEITDAKKALDVKNNILKGFQVGAAVASPAQAAAQGVIKPLSPSNLNKRA